MNKKLMFNLIFGTLLLFSIISFTAAANPNIPPSFPSGYEVYTLYLDNHQNSQSITFYAHVFNSSTGYLVTNTSNTYCIFDLYDSQGNEIINQNMSYNSLLYEYEININGGNFTTNGVYHNFIFCQNGGIGGAGLPTYFTVSPTGMNLTSSQALIFLGIFAFLVLILVFTISLFVRSTNETITLSIASLCGSYLSLFAIFFIAWLFSTNYLYATPILGSIFWIIWLILGIGALPFILIVPAYLLKKAGDNLVTNNLIKEGYSHEEAKSLGTKRK